MQCLECGYVGCAARHEDEQKQASEEDCEEGDENDDYDENHLERKDRVDTPSSASREHILQHMLVANHTLGKWMEEMNACVVFGNVISHDFDLRRSGYMRTKSERVLLQMW